MGRGPLTLVGTVGMCLVAVVSAVVVPVTGPVFRDAAPAIALELGARAGVAAAGLVTVVPTVVVWGQGKKGRVEDWVSRTTFSVTPAWPTRPLVPTHSPPHPH